MPWDFRGPDRTDAVSFVRSFCTDYTIWNDAAMASTKDLSGDDKRAAMDEASAAYARFLAPFISPDTKLQNIAFGSCSDFDPARLTTAAVEDVPNGCNVRFSIRHTFMDFGNDYIAEIGQTAGSTMALRQIWYLDPFAEDAQERLPYL